MTNAIEIELMRKEDVEVLRRKIRAFQVVLQDLNDSFNMFFEDDINHCKTGRWVIDKQGNRVEQ